MRSATLLSNGLTAEETLSATLLSNGLTAEETLEAYLEDYTVTIETIETIGASRTAKLVPKPGGRLANTGKVLDIDKKLKDALTLSLLDRFSAGLSAGINGLTIFSLLSFLSMLSQAGFIAATLSNPFLILAVCLIAYVAFEINLRNIRFSIIKAKIKSMIEDNTQQELSNSHLANPKTNQSKLTAVRVIANMIASINTGPVNFLIGFGCSFSGTLALCSALHITIAPPLALGLGVVYGLMAMYASAQFSHPALAETIELGLNTTVAVITQWMRARHPEQSLDTAPNDFNGFAAGVAIIGSIAMSAWVFNGILQTGLDPSSQLHHLFAAISKGLMLGSPHVLAITLAVGAACFTFAVLFIFCYRNIKKDEESQGPKTRFLTTAFRTLVAIGMPLLLGTFFVSLS